MENTTTPTPETARMMVSAKLAIHPAWGTAGLFLGIAIGCLGIVESATGLPFRLPQSFYTNRPVWYLLALALFLGGCYVLKTGQGREEANDASAADAKPLFDRLVLYTRAGCHLCDEAKAVLARYQPDLPKVEEIDVAADTRLEEQFGPCVPVVEIDGKVRFRGRVNEILLRRLIDQAKELRIRREWDTA